MGSSEGKTGTVPEQENSKGDSSKIQAVGFIKGITFSVISALRAK